MKLLTPMQDDLMVQQQVANTWQHFVGVICLNQTNRTIVKKILPTFFSLWPEDDVFLDKATEKTVKELIKPMGMVNKRYTALMRMSIDHLFWDRKDATMLYGIGQYGSESYRIFFKNERFEPKDKELRRYLGY
jgi:endonuclease III